MKTASISLLSLGVLAATAATAAAADLIDSPGPGYRQFGERTLIEPAPPRLQEDLTPVSMRLRKPVRSPEINFGPAPWDVPGWNAPAAAGEAPFSEPIRLFDLSRTKPVGGRYSFPKALPFEWLDKPVLSR